MEFYLNIAGKMIEYSIALIWGILGVKNVCKFIGNELHCGDIVRNGDMVRNHNRDYRKKRIKVDKKSV